MRSFFSSAICNVLQACQLQNREVGENHEEQQENTTSIFFLPEDVLSKQIFPFLSFREIGRLDSALVHHKLRTLFHDIISETTILGSVDFRNIRWCRKRKCYAKTLRVSSHLAYKHLDDALRFEELEIFPTAEVSRRTLLRLLTNGKELRKLTINSFFTTRIQSTDACLPLLEIDASGCSYLPEDVLVDLVKCCPHLQIINAANCDRMTERLTLALAEHCPNLEEVSLSINIQPNRLIALPHTGYCEMFQNCKQLRIFECTGDFTIANMLTLVTCCTGLTSVKIEYIDSLGGGAVPRTAQFDSLLYFLVKNNADIHTLKLNFGNNVSENTLIIVARYLPSLHTFQLVGCEDAVAGASAIYRYCTKLRTFEVYSNNYSIFPIDYRNVQLSMITTLDIATSTLSDEQLIWVAQANPDVQTLRINTSDFTAVTTSLSPAAISEALSYWSNLETFDVDVSWHGEGKFQRLEDFVLSALVQHCPKVSGVFIAGHANLSNDGISFLADLPLLYKLSVKGCVNLLDSGLSAIAQSCPKLQVIDLSQCTQITSAGINSLVQYRRHLGSVRLEGCERVQDSAIQNLIRRSRLLWVLDIYDNPQLTFAAVAELPKYCLYMIDLRQYATRKKPLWLEFDASYRSNRHYFDIICGWSKELRKEQFEHSRSQYMVYE